MFVSFARPFFLVSVLSLLSVVACDRDGSAQSTPSRQEAAPAASARGNERGFVLVELEPAPNALVATLQVEAKKAKAMGLKPFVEFWASWCEPCMALRRHMGDPRMAAAFKGTYIIQLSADDWGDDKLGGTGFDAGVIPIFYELADTGKPTGRSIRGSAWGEDVPDNMAPPLAKFFHNR